MKSDANPMQRAHNAPRCTAHSKRTGFLCKNPAVRAWTVCRMHGARGGQPSGANNSQWRHGLRGKEYLDARKLLSELSGGNGTGLQSNFEDLN
jgi:hypothetical protein